MIEKYYWLTGRNDERTTGCSSAPPLLRLAFFSSPAGGGDTDAGRPAVIFLFLPFRAPARGAPSISDLVSKSLLLLYLRQVSTVIGLLHQSSRCRGVSGFLLTTRHPRFPLPPPRAPRPTCPSRTVRFKAPHRHLQNCPVLCSAAPGNTARTDQPNPAL